MLKGKKPKSQKRSLLIIGDYHTSSIKKHVQNFEQLQLARSETMTIYQTIATRLIYIMIAMIVHQVKS